MLTEHAPIIRSKSIEPDHRELVNGPLYIPVLGRLFPRLWGDRREIRRARYLVHTDTGSVEVSENEFDQMVVGEPLLRPLPFR